MYWSYNNIYNIFYYLGILDILLAKMLIYKTKKKFAKENRDYFKTFKNNLFSKMGSSKVIT
jgi:hypothetical protein